MILLLLLAEVALWRLRKKPEVKQTPKCIHNIWECFAGPPGEKDRIHCGDCGERL